MTIYDFKVKDNLGREISLSEFKGKVLLIVNTTTGSGLTPQYEELERLYEKYKDQGFEILDFPCDQFGNQPAETAEAIQNICYARFGITFRQFAKIDVNGKNAAPLYKFLKLQKKGMFNEDIKWSFTKFLVDREGFVIERFAPTTTPDKIEKDIAELLRLH